MGNVYHYYNYGFNPDYLDPNNPQIGLSNMTISTQNNNLLCSFSRDNSNPNKNYYNLNTQQAYLAAAYGNLDSSASKYS